MKNIIAIAALIGGLTLAATSARAFDSGSDGSYGPLNITNDTLLPMPPNGIFNCTTITVASNATLTFLPNSLNTPVYLLAQGDIVVGGTIDVSGQIGQLNGAYSAAGPGGFAGGSAPLAGQPAGAGRGPGGGVVGAGYIDSGGGGSFANYGNLLLVPLLGGSGGAGYVYNSAPAASGGGGGGAILLASSSAARLAGAIRSRGGNGYLCGNGLTSGAGSGGGIRVVAPVVSGNGTLDVSTAIAPYPGGRIRVDCPPQSISLSLVGGISSVGRSMFVFPPNNPRLYFVDAAGQAIDPAILSAVNVLLPTSTNLVQNFSLRGENFLGDVPVTVVAAPDNGTPFTNSIVMRFPTNTLATVTVTVPLTLAPNQNNHINAYARYGVQP